MLCNLLETNPFPFRVEKQERSTVNFDADGPGSLRVLVIPIFLLLEGLLASLPGNTSLGDQVTRLLARHAKLIHYVLLLKEFDLQGLRAISVVLCVLAHVSKPPFQVPVITSGISHAAE